MYLFMLRRWAHNSTYMNEVNPHNRIDAAHLAAGTPGFDDDPMAYYLGYYD
jgi:hypothetical protein